MSEELMCRAGTTPTISVIMPAYNAAHYMERSLPPLMEMLEQGTVSEVIVVDDCSTEASTAELARRGGARTIRTPGTADPALRAISEPRKRLAKSCGSSMPM